MLNRVNKLNRDHGLSQLLDIRCRRLVTESFSGSPETGRAGGKLDATEAGGCLVGGVGVSATEDRVTNPQRHIASLFGETSRLSNVDNREGRLTGR